MNVKLAFGEWNGQRVLHFDGDSKLLMRDRFAINTDFDIRVADSEVILREEVEFSVHDTRYAGYVEGRLNNWL